MLGIGAIEIEEASYNLGMCGHIVVRINATGKRYRVMLGEECSLDEWMVSWDYGHGWTQPKRMKAEIFIALLPQGHGMTVPVFIALWAGFAACYEKCLADGRSKPILAGSEA